MEVLRDVPRQLSEQFLRHSAGRTGKFSTPWNIGNTEASENSGAIGSCSTYRGSTFRLTGLGLASLSVRE